MIYSYTTVCKTVKSDGDIPIMVHRTDNFCYWSSPFKYWSSDCPSLLHEHCNRSQYPEYCMSVVMFLFQLADQCLTGCPPLCLV